MITVRSVAGSGTTTSPNHWALPAFPTNPVKGDTIVVCQSWFNGTARASTAPTDTFSNTYTQVGTDSTFAATAGVAMWSAPVTTTGASFVVTVNLNGVAFLAGAARCLAGTLPTAYTNADFTKVSTSGTTTATTGNTAAAPKSSLAFFIACLSDLQTGPAAYTPIAGWNDRGLNWLDNTAGQDLGTADFLNPAATVQASTWTGPNGTYGTYAAMIASFTAGPDGVVRNSRPFPFKPGQPPSTGSPFR